MNITVSDGELVALHAALNKGRNDVRAAMALMDSPEFLHNRLSDHEKKLIEIITTQLTGMLLVMTLVIDLFERAEGITE